jgi:hypothetical protein
VWLNEKSQLTAADAEHAEGWAIEEIAGPLALEEPIRRRAR